MGNLAKLGIFNITKLHLTILWIFVSVFWIFNLKDFYNNHVSLFVGVPFFLFLYTFGWIRHNLDFKKSEKTFYIIYMIFPTFLFACGVYLAWLAISPLYGLVMVFFFILFLVKIWGPILRRKKD